MSKQKSILITGANGFTGQHACEYFKQQNYQVIGTVRKQSSVSGAGSGRGSFLPCNLGDIREIEDVVDRVRPDYVLHLAGKNSAADSWANPTEAIYTNVMGTVHLLESIRAYAPKARTVVAGSTLRMPEFSSDPLHPYAVSKAMQVLISRTWHQLFGLDIIVANPCNLIGPGSSAGVCANFAEKIVSMENHKIPSLLQVNDLAQTRDFLDVRDAVRAYAVLFEKGKPGEQYDLGTGQELSIKAVAETFQELADVSFTIKSEREASSSVPAVPLPKNLEKIRNLGWAPEFSFRESAEAILRYHREKQEKKEI